jgi:hypothetical protein
MRVVQRFDDAYITWVNNGNLAWTHYARGLDTDTAAEIGPRPISQEPMVWLLTLKQSSKSIDLVSLKYIIANLGISHGFGTLDPDLIFPSTMSIDWIRVYQPSNAIRTTCDPEDFPTAEYIETYVFIRSLREKPQLNVYILLGTERPIRTQN